MNDEPVVVETHVPIAEVEPEEPIAPGSEGGIEAAFDHGDRLLLLCAWRLGSNGLVQPLPVRILDQDKVCFRFHVCFGGLGN